MDYLLLTNDNYILTEHRLIRDLKFLNNKIELTKRRIEKLKITLIEQEWAYFQRNNLVSYNEINIDPIETNGYYVKNFVYDLAGNIIN